jgi:LemA protein
MLITALVGAVLVLLAWALWAAVRKWNRTRAIMAAAPVLPIKLVNVWDTVWIRGDLWCDEPQTVPHFGYSCVHFTYRLEEQVTRTRTNSDGKTETYTQWETRQTLSGCAPFAICQGSDVLQVESDKAQWHYEKSDIATAFNWRHSCAYMPYPGLASIVGVVGDSKQTLGPLMHVPLVVTPRDRADYLKAAERGERWTARFGLLLLLIGLALVGFGLCRYLQTKATFSKHEWWDPLAGFVGVLVGVSGTLLLWTIRTYNSLVIFRTRADMSWSQINVQLKQRYDLIPRLVEVVKGYVAHEKAVLEKLAGLRAQVASGGMAATVSAEQEAVHGLTRVLALAEAYPQLKANDQFRHLSDQITVLEEKIAHARGFFNDSVKEFNVHIAVFPASLVARMCGFHEYPMFSVEMEKVGGTA